MKKVLTILLFVFITATVIAQKIQYSRQTFRPPYAEAFQLVTDIGGTHHLLFFTASERPAVFVYNTALQLQVKREFNFKLPENCVVQIISFSSHYLLYLHRPGSPVHKLYRVTAAGEESDVSGVLSAPADSVWNRSVASFQLSAENGRLVLIGHSIYDALKKIVSRVVFFGDDLSVRKVQTVFFPFDRAAENLQQVQLVNDELVVLKTGQHGAAVLVLSCF